VITARAAAVLALAAAWIICCSATVYAATASGVVVDQHGHPVAGVTVYLIHPTVGRSLPRTTGQDGAFVFETLPSVPDTYVLEIYWGRTLLYQKSYMIKEGTKLTIVLKRVPGS